MPNDMVARVDGRDITVQEFRRAYLTQLQVYRAAYGGNVSEQMLKQLGHRPADPAADGGRAGVAGRGGRAGASTSPTPRSPASIMTMPAFQENGQFVGHARYAALLRMQRPPMSPEEFEAQPASQPAHRQAARRRSPSG